MSIRIAIVAPSLGILGGQAIQADRLLRAWHGDPDVEAWLVPHNPEPPRGLRAAVHVKYLRTIVTELLYLKQLLRELPRADVVHVFSASYWSFLLAPTPAALIARAFGRPVILNYRSGEAPDHLKRSAIARWVLRRVDRNVVPSRFLARVFEQFGIASVIVPNTVDTNRFRYRERNPLTPRLLSTRNFEPLYNVACTLRAFRLVLDQQPAATLTLVGGGSEEPALRRLAGELGLGAAVMFTGQVAPDDIARHYAAHDIYVQSPNIDNMPASVLEAFASGLPVVATDVGGVSAILTGGVHGLLVPADDHRAMAAGILRLLNDPGCALTLARAAHETCASYQWPAVRERWFELYRGVLRTAGAQAPMGTRHAT